MIPRDVAELLREAYDRIGHADLDGAETALDGLSAALTRAFGERVLECSTCVDEIMDIDGTFTRPTQAVEVSGSMKCPDCGDQNHLRVRER